ncbi:MAG: hypothetical protein HY335_06950, partial [Deinococcus sp.]|nr:hypothetical protein [Deinococcus sp.]
QLLAGDDTMIRDLYQRERQRLAGIWGADILDPERREAAQARFFAALRAGQAPIGDHRGY